jgi:RNA polymerase sigma-70 factor (ECF subfamily)
MASDFFELHALQRGDPVAWTAAFPHLWPIALRAASHPEACLVPWEAEDVAHDAMIELIQSIDDVRNVDEMKGFLSTIAYRSAIDYSRRKYAGKRSPPAELDEAHEVPSTPELGPADLREMTLLIRKAFDVLDRQTQRLLIEKVAMDLTYDEISKKHRVPIGTVCTKVARGLKRVQAALAEAPELVKELRHYLR